MVGESRRRPRLIQNRISLRLVVGTYALMTVVAVGLSQWLLDRPPVVVGTRATPLWLGVGLGAVYAFVVVRASAFMTERSAAMRAMGAKLGALVGRVTLYRAAVMGAASGVGEELLFRGFLLPYIAFVLEGWGVPHVVAWVMGLLLSSLLFGLAHSSNQKDLRWWPAFAFVVGVGFGALTWWTGAVIAAVVAHFAINYFNLLALPDVREA